LQGRISVRRLALTDFRCYERLRVETDGGPVVLAGPNGAGKTNVLEALSFLVPGRGLRRARLADVSRRLPGETLAGEAPRAWAVAAQVQTADGPCDIGTGLDPADAEGARRVVRIDGAPARGQAALGERVSALWLTPDMQRLFTEGSTGRRRFLDRLVFAFDPAHAGRITAYERGMRDRARLLRDAHEARRAADPAWLDALEDQMATRGVAIAAARDELVRRLNPACAAGVGPFPAAGLVLEGTVETWLTDRPAVEVEDRFRDALREARTHDAVAGGAACGPHRSDLAVTHLGRGVPAAQCSTGEQKAVLVSIVLANARLRARETGAAPLLLLDEIAAHLDEARRIALFDEIRALGAQAWMTGTDVALFAPLRSMALFLAVDDARVRPAGTDNPRSLTGVLS
jgi:DNA replication and repair protein RecF